MSDRLSDEQVAWHVKYHNADWARHNLACEVLASRKLIADLRALEPERVTPGSLKHQGYMRALQRVRRLIEEAGL